MLYISQIKSGMMREVEIWSLEGLRELGNVYKYFLKEQWWCQRHQKMAFA
jgi:hypothetical protein